MPRLTRGVLFVLALACGVSVANIYFPQALTSLIAAGLHVSSPAATLVATAAQLGYAVGVFLLIPLGDRVPHRPLIITLIIITGLGLLGAALAPSLAALVGIMVVVGLTTVVPQVLIPMAAGMVGVERRGQVTGTLLSGVLGGILLARTFGGTVGSWLGWRAPFLVSAVLALALAVALAFFVPATTPPSRQSYPALLGSALRLLKTESQLRRSALYQGFMFAGFSASWTSLALLVTGPRYHLGPTAVGLIALVGAASMFCTPIAGRRVDRQGSDQVSLFCFVLAIVAAGLMMVGQLGGVVGLVVLTSGLVLLDIATQCGQVANQSRIFARRLEMRSRMNTAYMTCVFLGGTVGSWLGVRAYTWLGWPGVCGLVALFASVVLVRHVLRRPDSAADGSVECEPAVERETA